MANMPEAPKQPAIVKLMTIIGALAGLFSLWEFMLVTFALAAIFVYGVQKDFLAGAFWVLVYLSLKAVSAPRSGK